MPSLIDYLVSLLAVIVGNLILFYSLPDTASATVLTFTITFLPLFIFIFVASFKKAKPLYWYLMVDVIAILSNFAADILIFNFTDSVKLMLVNGSIAFGFLLLIMIGVGHIAHFAGTFANRH